MNKLAILLLAVAGTCAAADIRYTWLPFSNNVLGAPQTQSDVMQYGINVFLHSDNPLVTEFQVTAVVKTAAGEVRVFNGTVTRENKVASVQYSTVCAMWVDTQPNFEVLTIQVKALSSSSTSKPIAGTEYTAGDNSGPVAK